MKLFMEPKSVALIGISRKSGPGSFNIMENMMNFGYQGHIFPVNPGVSEILGKKTFPSVKAVPRGVDLAVISTPRHTTVQILRDCIEAGIKAAIIVNQGFNDADGAGKRMQAEIANIAKTRGIRVLGPNTLGVMNSFYDFTTSFMPVVKERSPVGLICQSGIHLVGPGELAGKIGKAVDLGNACDIGFYDALNYFADDPQIKLIAIHMEGLNQGKAFISLLRNVVKDKPVVIHKSGSSRTGARAALSHTGSIAGNYQLLKTAFKQSGAIFLEDGGQMPLAVKTLSNLPPMKGGRVAVVTYSGGAGIMTSDGLERCGLELAPLAPETTRGVAALSPEWLPLGNPMDIWPAVMLQGPQAAYTAALTGVLADPRVDGVLCIAIAPAPEFSFLDVSTLLNRLVEEFAQDKPVVAWLYGPNTKAVGERLETENRIMTYPTLETAVWALSLLRDRHKTIGKE